MSYASCSLGLALRLLLLLGHLFDALLVLLLSWLVSIVGELNLMEGLGFLGQSLEFCAYGVGRFPPHAGHELGNVALITAGLARLHGRHVLERMCAVENP